MKCPKCQFRNREGSKFCKKCGSKLELVCPSCGYPSEAGSIFCDECGHKLDLAVETKETPSAFEGERKHATVLFSDLSGYTALTEKVDPEEVKEIMGRIFGEIARVVEKYEGVVERFFGDEVMALFGVPNAHEDDPIRAIKAAMEIHDLVQTMSPRFERRIGQPLAMHIGVNTGLLVTGDEYIGKGRHGLTGDTINLAARLTKLAQQGEVLVGPYTCRQAEGHFTFKSLGSTQVKGKREPVKIYLVVSEKERPRKVHRLHGLRADLIGRKAEMAQLVEAVQRLRNGEGSVLSILGDAGTGKSRLIEEFKATLDLKEIQWREGHAYAYAQNMPYFPLIDMMNRAWQIEEGDPPETVRERIETGVEDLIGKRQDIIPYIGSLYSLNYPEIEGIDPAFWKAQLHKAIQDILSALARQGPTVLCVEDLHWADPSSLDLLRFVLSSFRYPAVFLFVFRSYFSFMTAEQRTFWGKTYQEIHLQDLSPSEAQDMTGSLLGTQTIPDDLKRFVEERVEGNPFYLEEVINALIETETLVRDNGSWNLTRAISESGISPTIHGVISGRLDRLDRKTRRILQEASVIGRAFLYEILRRVTDLEAEIDLCLSGLERLDLIRTRSFHPDLEYIFKHALTREVVYKGLLKEDRRKIHERIALVVEGLFQDRLPEFYETLAFHFTQGRVEKKALLYLMKSGEKSLKRYSVEESHKYYQKAFDIILEKPRRTPDDNELLIDTINSWALVFYYRGDFKGLEEMMGTHMDIADTITDKVKLGIFYSWFGFSLFCREKINDSFAYLQRALKLGEQIQNDLVICSACTWLAWACADLGLFQEGIQYGERAQKICKYLDPDSILFFQSLGGMSFNYFYMGASQPNFDIGNTLIDYGRKHSSNRSQVVGHIAIGHGHWAEGNLSSTIRYYQEAAEIAKDPFYLEWPRLFLGMSFALNGQFDESEPPLRKALEYGLNYGCESIGSPAALFLGVALIAKGHMWKGLKMVEEKLHSCKQKERRFGIALVEYILGRIFCQITLRTQPISISAFFRNAIFLARYLPVAEKKAMTHFNSAIQAASEIGASGIMGQTYLDMGILHKSKKKTGEAVHCFSRAIETFERCGAKTYLEQAKKLLSQCSNV